MEVFFSIDPELLNEMTDASEPINDSSSSGRSRRSKVERVVAESDMEDIEEELVRRWTADSDERSSLRDLADFFNRQVLQSALEDANVRLLAGETENLYRLLQNDEVTGGNYIKAKRRLEREGIDVDALTDDFVSHQAVHTYLTKHREVTPPSDGSRDVESSRESIERLQARTESVVENTLSSLRAHGDIDLPEFDVFVNIRVTCRNCGRHQTVVDLFEQDGCSCAK